MLLLYFYIFFSNKYLSVFATGELGQCTVSGGMESHNNDGRNVTRLNGAIVSRIITRQGDNRVNISTGATPPPPSGLKVVLVGDRSDGNICLFC